MPLISIIVPIYKVKEDYIKKCLDSLVNQTFQDIEIILVDDGTPDNGGSICDEYSKKDKRVKVIHQKNQGVSIARNNGMKIATGEWITFVDADDWIELNTFKLLVSWIDKNKLDIIIFGMKINYLDTEKTNPFWIEEKRMLDINEIRDLQIQILHKAAASFKPPYNMVGVAVCKLYKKKYLKSIKLKYNPNLVLSEDGLFVFEALENTKKIGYIDKCLYHYRKHEGSATRTYRENAEQEYTEGLIEFKKILTKYNKNNSFNIGLWYRAIHNIFAITNQLYCAEENSQLKKQNIKKLKVLCKTEPYLTAIQQLSFKKIYNESSLYRSFSFLLLKLGFFRMFYIISILKNSLKAK